MSLHVLAYNFKRLITLLGVTGMMAAVRTYALLWTLHGVSGAIAVLGRSEFQKSRQRALSAIRCLHWHFEDQRPSVVS